MSARHREIFNFVKHRDLIRFTVTISLPASFRYDYEHLYHLDMFVRDDTTLGCPAKLVSFRYNRNKNRKKFRNYPTQKELFRIFRNIPKLECFYSFGCFGSTKTNRKTERKGKEERRGKGYGRERKGKGKGREGEG